MRRYIKPGKPGTKGGDFRVTYTQVHMWGVEKRKRNMFAGLKPVRVCSRLQARQRTLAEGGVNQSRRAAIHPTQEAEHRRRKMPPQMGSYAACDVIPPPRTRRSLVRIFDGSVIYIFVVVSCCRCLGVLRLSSRVSGGCAAARRALPQSRAGRYVRGSPYQRFHRWPRTASHCFVRIGTAAPHSRSPKINAHSSVASQHPPFLTTILLCTHCNLGLIDHVNSLHCARERQTAHPTQRPLALPHPTLGCHGPGARSREKQNGRCRRLSSDGLDSIVEVAHCGGGFQHKRGASGPDFPLFKCLL